LSPENNPRKKPDDHFLPNWWTKDKLQEVRSALELCYPVELDTKEKIDSKDTRKERLADPNSLRNQLSELVADIIDSPLMENLTDLQRKIVTMHYLENLNFREIATELAIHYSAVLVNESRGVELLARLINPPKKENQSPLNNRSAMEIKHAIKVETLGLLCENIPLVEIGKKLLANPNFMIDIFESNAWLNLDSKKKIVIEQNLLEELGFEEIGGLNGYKKQNAWGLFQRGMKTFVEALFQEMDIMPTGQWMGNAARKNATSKGGRG
jgi:predicted DNA-binding protein YlxM (UPF0122 family)